MIVANQAFHRWSDWSVPIGLAMTAGMVGMAWWARLRLSDLGLGRSTWSSGLRSGDGVRRRRGRRIRVGAAAADGPGCGRQCANPLPQAMISAFHDSVRHGHPRGVGLPRRVVCCTVTGAGGRQRSCHRPSSGCGMFRWPWAVARRISRSTVWPVGHSGAAASGGWHGALHRSRRSPVLRVTVPQRRPARARGCH